MASEPAARTEPLPVAVVLPDVSGIDREFDYSIPASLASRVAVGTLVRVDLHGRRVGAWVTSLRPDNAAERSLKPLAKVTGVGPTAEVVELARWAGWRWAGRVRSMLTAASPPSAVAAVARGPARPRRMSAVDPFLAKAVTGGATVLRWPPSFDTSRVVTAALVRSPVLVVTPSVDQARLLAARLRRGGPSVAVYPRDWAAIAAGAPDVVIGARACVWAPLPDVGAIVVIDEHDEGLKEERTPCWHARDVAIERARRLGVPCVLVSPCPTLEARNWGELVTLSRNEERSGWPIIEVVDRSAADPFGPALLGDALVRHIRAGERVVCVINRTGRARLLACRSCKQLTRCERCAAAVTQDADGMLVCRRCGAVRPLLCSACGATRLAALRLGATRLREELEALAGESVVEVTGARSGNECEDARIVVGTEAVLHRVATADVVAFLDFDDELLAPRYRAHEQALALLARAARVVGGREGGGRLVVQTRLPRHEVVVAAVAADPDRLTRTERARRFELRLPPVTALAAVSGPGADELIAGLRHRDRLDVLGPSGGHWLVKAPDHETLCGALAETPRPHGRVRVDVDPLRV